jgi:hypothetical protein
MSSIQVQPFHRRDRQQLADLANAHAAAVVPGAGVSVAALLSHLEREPGEFLVDPWVRERVTLVARQNDRVAAAAHLLRYVDDERVGPTYRNSGEIRWLLFWPEAPVSENPWWTDGARRDGAHGRVPHPDGAVENHEPARGRCTAWTRNHCTGSPARQTGPASSPASARRPRSASAR